MNTPANLWQQLDEELHPRLIAVNFHPIDFPAVPLPELNGVSYVAFEAPYALLFCVRIPNEDPKEITVATNFTCETMRAALAKAGANDWSRDGYVLAAIQKPPSTTETKQSLRNFEQSRSICRRHALWPESHSSQTSINLWTTRADRVTVLSLPPPEMPAPPTEPPLPGAKFLETIESRLKSGAPYKLVAEEIVAEARAREDFHAP